MNNQNRVTMNSLVNIGLSLHLAVCESVIPLHSHLLKKSSIFPQRQFIEDPFDFSLIFIVKSSFIHI